MKIAILCIGTVEMDVIGGVQNGLCEVFPETTCVTLKDSMPIPKDAYNKKRRQYYSSNILTGMHDYVVRSGADRVLGVTEADLYVPSLNFVFGEAQYPGRVAIISLFRLKPEFYGHPSNRELFVERSVKEAVHEIGHTLGMMHCRIPSCVMFFSNSILDTDRKKIGFCQNCYPLVMTHLEKL